MEDFDAKALEARQDERKLNSFIAESEDFILRQASKATGRYITTSDDEWSIAEIAFDEAIRSYDETKGAFAAFSSVVIKRRLIDFIRSESRFADNTTLVAPHIMDGNLDEEDAEGASGAVNLAVQQKSAELSAQAAREAGTQSSAQEEIAAANAKLAEYGFSFFDLTECSPKAEKTKEACAEAVKALIRNPELLEKMRAKKALPMKELEKASGVSKKILDRHRKYIIAAAEIISGEYPILREYLSYIRKALET